MAGHGCNTEAIEIKHLVNTKQERTQGAPMAGWHCIIVLALGPGVAALFGNDFSFCSKSKFVFYNTVNSEVSNEK